MGRRRKLQQSTLSSSTRTANETDDYSEEVVGKRTRKEQRQQVEGRPTKRSKSETHVEHNSNNTNTNQGSNYVRPKSRKELRAERKALLKKTNEQLIKEEKIKQKKILEKKAWKEYRKLEQKQKKERQQKRLNRERNSSSSSSASSSTKNKKGSSGDGTSTTSSGNKNKKKKKSSNNSDDTTTTFNEQDMVKRIAREIKHGKMDEISGYVTIEHGIQYKDIIIGNGPIVKNSMVLTVKYKLTAYPKSNQLGTTSSHSKKTQKQNEQQQMIVLDSSNKFNFRLGKSEVISGWDIGLQGARVGGRRKLIIPPKVGYGSSQDIGAGPGAILYFDITILNIK